MVPVFFRAAGFRLGAAAAGFFAADFAVFGFLAAAAFGFLPAFLVTLPAAAAAAPPLFFFALFLAANGWLVSKSSASYLYRAYLYKCLIKNENYNRSFYVLWRWPPSRTPS